MVKKFFSIIAMFALLLTSCEMPKEETPAQFHITSDTTLVADASGTCYPVSYVIDEVVEGATVTATPSAEWIHIGDPITDTDIPICIDNNYGEERTGTVVVKYANTKATITVTQKLCKIAIDKIVHNLNSTESCIYVLYSIRQEVEGGKVSATTPDSWIHLNEIDPITETAINFCVDANEGEARTGVLYVSYANDMVTLVINQEASAVI